MLASARHAGRRRGARWMAVRRVPEPLVPRRAMAGGSLSLAVALGTVRRAGLTGAEVYAALPDQRRAAFLYRWPTCRDGPYAPGPLRDLLSVGRQGSGRFPADVVRPPPRRMRRTSRAPPSHARVLPGCPEAAVISAIRDRANLIAADLGLPQVTGGIVIAVDYAPAAKATLLLFGPDGLPRLVAKLARRVEGERALVTEYDALTSLWAARRVRQPRTAPSARPRTRRRTAGAALDRRAWDPVDGPLLHARSRTSPGPGGPGLRCRWRVAGSFPGGDSQRNGELGRGGVRGVDPADDAPLPRRSRVERLGIRPLRPPVAICVPC